MVLANRFFLWRVGVMDYFNSLSDDDQRRFSTSVKSYAVKLDDALANADAYNRRRDERIRAIKETAVKDRRGEYDRQAALFDEFFQCSFDSAYVAARRCHDIANEIGDIELITDAHIKMSEAYVSGGYFREADRIINGFSPEGLSRDMLIRLMMARFSLEFEDGFFFAWRLFELDESLAAMQRIYEQTLPLLPDDSYEVYYLKMALAFHNHDFVSGANYAQILLLKTPKDSWRYINTLGNIGYNLIGAGDYTEAMKYMCQSAIMAIERGSVNYSALRKIAELVYVVGETEKASRYINLSMDNATAYNSKYSIIEASKSYPMIVRELSEANRRSRVVISIIALSLGVIAVALLASL